MAVLAPGPSGTGSTGRRCCTGCGSTTAPSPTPTVSSTPRADVLAWPRSARSLNPPSRGATGSGSRRSATGRVGGHTQDVHPPNLHLHDEQDVQPLQEDRVHMKEIAGQQTVGL